MANKLGKRYHCTKCVTTALCLKESSGEIQCCGAEMEEVVPKPLASSD